MSTDSVKYALCHRSECTEERLILDDDCPYRTIIFRSYKEFLREYFSRENNERMHA